MNVNFFIRVCFLIILMQPKYKKLCRLGTYIQSAICYRFLRTRNPELIFASIIRAELLNRACTICNSSNCIQRSVEQMHGNDEN